MAKKSHFWDIEGHSVANESKSLVYGSHFVCRESNLMFIEDNFMIIESN